MKVSKTAKGFHVSKNEKELIQENIKGKAKVTNEDLRELLLLILEGVRK